MSRWLINSFVFLSALTVAACGGGGGGGGASTGGGSLCGDYDLKGVYRLACPIRGNSVWHTTYLADECTSQTTGEGYPVHSGEYIRTDVAVTQSFELYPSQDSLLAIDNVANIADYDYAYVLNATWITGNGGGAATSKETYAFVVDGDGTIHGQCWVTFIGDGNAVEMAGGASIDSGQSNFSTLAEAGFARN
ncbi:MAG: hypothetical protein ACNS63_12645 [Candidatus Nitrospinota bacterium M3_3B_026]